MYYSPAWLEAYLAPGLVIVGRDIATTSATDDEWVAIANSKLTSVDECRQIRVGCTCYIVVIMIVFESGS